MGTILFVSQRSQAEYTANIFLPARFYQTLQVHDKDGVLAFRVSDEQIQAGILLYQTLFDLGLATAPVSEAAYDGLELIDCRITNAVRCVPPENKPVGKEINACRPFLVSRLAELKSVKALVTLGKISHDSTLRALGLKVSAHPFGHDVHYEIQSPFDGAPLHIVSSYHCSRYNTNTGRLTPEMFQAVFEQAKDLRRT